MTSAKCFINWFKEAGRGHLVSVLGWGSFILYTVLAVTRLSFDTDTTFYGIAAAEPRWICMALGIIAAFTEFYYLFSQRKQDFYYSLPVSRGMIFWTRYVHGIVQVIVPLILSMSLCGIYQAFTDTQFAPYAGAYTGKSILAYAASFLVFYHLAALCILICGNIISAAVTCAAAIVFFPILTGSVCVTLSRNYFATYYKNPFLSWLYTVLSPERLTGSLSGEDVFFKPEVLVYAPGLSVAVAAGVWIVLLLVLVVLAQRSRKTERTGRIFALAAGERTVQALVSFLAGVWIFAFLSDVLFDMPEAPSAAILTVISAAGAAAVSVIVHCLLECMVSGMSAGVFRRKYQLIVTVALTLAAGLAFPAGAHAYDSYFPEDAVSVGISIDGIGMDYWTYTQSASGEEEHGTEVQMDEFLMKEEGRAALMGWLGEVIRSGENGNISDANVCYHTADGAEHYRTYALSREQVEMFASVYETEEYLKKAYPAVTLTDVSEDRFTWEDGVRGTALKITGEEKEALLDAYRLDVSGLNMASLCEALPNGYIRIKSSEDGGITDVYVYPFFEKTCALLGEYGVDTQKSLADYDVDSIEVMEYSSVPEGVSGGVHMSYYEQEDEVAELKETLVPDALDIQPLLYPLDHSSDIDVSVIDEETNSVIHVSCAERGDRAR